MSDMSWTPAGSSPPSPQRSEQELNSLRTVVMVVYGLQALSLFFGMTALIALIINYVKRDDARGTWYESHFTWQIRSFWWALLWLVVGSVLVIVGVGILILLGVWVWMIYRVVKGWLRLIEGRPVFPRGQEPREEVV